MDAALPTLSRRTALRAGLAAGGAVATLGVTGTGAGAADAAVRTAVAPAGLPATVFPGIIDASHATPRVAALVRDLFVAKSRHDAAALASFYANPDAFFVDAANGLGAPTWQALSDFFTFFFASGLPPAAISYALRVVGDERGAAVELVDTPEFFGLDLRVLTTLTFDRNLKIVRAVDYWDGRAALSRNTIGAAYPTDFKDGRQTASAAMVRTANTLQAALAAGDAASAVALMTPDVVLEDFAARTYLRGSAVVRRYLARGLASLPYGRGAGVVHVTGGRPGGSYEWKAGPAAAPLRRGHTVLELDRDGRISRLTAMYDSSVLDDAAYGSLVALAAEGPF